jgi:predicted RND superfamily exporter protein
LSDRIAKRLIECRLLLLTLGAVLTAAALPFSLTTESDLSVQSLFPPNDPKLMLYNRTATEFGGEATVLAVYRDPDALTIEGLERLARIRAELAEAPSVVSALCLADLPHPTGDGVAASLGRSIFERAKQSLSGNQAATSFKTPNLLDWFRNASAEHQAECRKRILTAELYRDAFISADGDVVAVLLQVDRNAMASGAIESTIRRLRSIVENSPPSPGHLVGAPVMINDVYGYLTADATRLQWASTLTMIVVIGLLFRNLRWMLLPLVVVGAAVVWTRAFMKVLDIRQSLIASMTESIVTVIGVAAVVHVAVFFVEDSAATNGVRPDAKDALQRTLSRMIGSFFWTCVITAVGFASLFVARVRPVQQYAAVMTAASLFVGVASVLFIPGGALIGRRWLTAAPTTTRADVSIQAGLFSIVRFVGRHAWTVLIVLVAGMGVASIGFRWLNLETEFTKNFRADAPVLTSYNFVESHLGGAGVLEVVFSADRVTPELLQSMREASEEIRLLPLVTKVNGLHDVVDFAGTLAGVSVTERGPWRDWFRREFVEQSILSIMKRLRDGQSKRLVNAFWNQDAKRVRLMIRVKERQDVGSKSALLVQLRDVLHRRFGDSAEPTGIFVMLVFLVDTLMQDQWTAVAAAAVGVIITASLAFQSVRLGFVAFAPKLVLVAAVVGAMGWLGMKVNVATAMIGSVSMGLVVAFSVPYLNRFRQERAAGAPFYDALAKTHTSAGKAMVFANLALMLGFLILAGSRFLPTVHFGVLVSVAILGGVIGNLLLLPVLLRFVYLQPPPEDNSASGAA